MNQKDSHTDQALSAPAPDTSADTLALKADEFRSLLRDWTMAKGLGYVSEKGRAPRFQIRVPDDIKQHFGGKDILRIPLGLPDGPEAKRKATALYLAYLDTFARLQHGAAGGAWEPAPPPPKPARPLSDYTPEEMRAMVIPGAKGMNYGQHEAIATGTQSFTQLVSTHSAMSAEVRSVASGKGSWALDLLSAAYLHTAGVPFDPHHESFRRFVFVSASAIRQGFLEAAGKRLEGEDVPPPPTPEKMTPIGAALRIPERIQSGESPGITLGTVIGRYVAQRERQGTGPEITRKIKRCLSIFGPHAGLDTPVTALRTAHVMEFLENIQRLPHDWATRVDHEGATVAQLLAQEWDKPMSPTTFDQSYKGTLKAFLKDSQTRYREDGFPILADVVELVHYTREREEDEEQQRAFTLPELKRLFEGAAFQAVARGEPSAIGGKDADALYWLPVIALYTGARGREICQINPQCDWGEEDGIAFLRFDHKTPAGAGVKKSMKTDEVRRIPIHPDLVRLGLPSYLQRMKDAGADRLFPGAPIKRSAKGNPFERAGDWIREFFRDAGMRDDSPGQCVTGLHAFRKVMVTHGANQGIPTYAIAGHKPEWMTRVQWRSYYTAPAALSTILKDLERITFAVEIPMQRSASWSNL
ncbi:hypothetical protein P3G55_19035 [Leptospira sp. 96542]|nr:hypothetical protein [Leptospira sp. 96542]